MTAGERRNILISFLCFTSQVVLRNPISVIGLGEGSTGKTHVLEIALLLIPDELIEYEKKPTLPSMFRRSEIDPYHYDGKIVVYGDMGGENDQDEARQCKDIIKELQSDAYLNRPVTVSTSEGFEVVDLELFGRPCLAYTTVPNYDFDSQEKSRSLIFTAREDNKEVFDERKNVLEFIGGRTYNTFLKYQKEVNEVKNIVMGLRSKFKDVMIINPYTESIINFIGDTEYYKRDYDKYNGILKAITAFNSVNREICCINGNNVIFTTKEDIKLFLSLFEIYHDAISTNLSPKASDILGDMRDNFSSYNKESILGISVLEYVEQGNVKASLRSIHRYFKELEEEGFIKVNGNLGRTQLYDLTEKSKKGSLDDLLQLSDSARNRIRQEYGSHYLKIIEEDRVDNNLSIMLHHDLVEVPSWCDL